MDRTSSYPPLRIAVEVAAWPLLGGLLWAGWQLLALWR